MSEIIYSNEHKYTVDRLIKARKSAKLDQAGAARLLGRTQSYISKIESGQRRIDIIFLKKIASFYKKPIKYFIK